ncbi:MAG TPA: ribonuclease Z [Methanomicrobiales archaeon]|nr:ribonuclease Z [Methanomicrobiales archaeon]
MTGETLHVHFLGTAGALPTPQRNLPCIMVRRGSDTLLFDCGEGAQQQMMRARTGFTVNAVFITHWHADHFLGAFGLAQTLSFMGRTEPLTLYGPPGVHEFAGLVAQLCRNTLRFPVESVEMRGGSVVEFGGYAVHAFATQHGIQSLGYVLAEDPRPGRFDRERAVSLGVNPGPLFGRLQRGETVRVTTNGQERVVRPDEVMGPPRAGRRICYTGDTRPVEDRIREIAGGADLLIHDATFDDRDRERAEEVHHSTAGEAGAAAAALGVRTLALVHISPRYTTTVAHVEDARRHFTGEVIAPADLVMLDIPFRD